MKYSYSRWYQSKVFLWVLPTRLTLVFSLFGLKSAVRAQPPLTVVGATDIDTRFGIRIRRRRSAFRHQTSIDAPSSRCFQSPLSSFDSPCCSVLFGTINSTWVPLFRGRSEISLKLIGFFVSFFFLLAFQALWVILWSL